MTDDIDDVDDEVMQKALILVLATIKRMSRTKADEYLKHKFKNMAPDFRSELMDTAGCVDVTPPNVPKSKMYAVLWMCGATWSQIAALGDIQRSTAARLASTYLPASDRAQYRAQRSDCAINLQYETVSALRDIYIKLLNDDPFLIQAHDIKALATRVLIEYKQHADEFNEEESNSAY